MVEDYIIHLKGRGLRKSSIDGQISALELFFSMNESLEFQKNNKDPNKIRKKIADGLGKTKSKQAV
jgi:hypothetical protein